MIRINENGDLEYEALPGFWTHVATAAELKAAFAERGMVVVPKETLHDWHQQITGGLWIDHDCPAIYALAAILPELMEVLNMPLPDPPAQEPQSVQDFVKAPNSVREELGEPVAKAAFKRQEESKEADDE